MVRVFSFSSLVSIFWVPCVVFTIHAIVSFPPINLYQRWEWFDIPMHFLGGVSIGIAALAFLSILRERSVMVRLPWMISALFLMAFVGLAASAWELFEFTVTQLLGIKFQGDLQDTMADMFFGLLGGFAVALVLLFEKKSKNNGGL